MPFSQEIADQLSPPEGQPLARAGEQLANLPSNIFNDMTRMWYNLGFKLDDNQAPVEVPKPFDLKAPTGFGEKAVDVGAGIAQQVPLILGGEGAAGALAKSAELPTLLTRLIKPATGFGLSGLTESPEEGALQGGMGAAFGAAEAAPPLLRTLLAGGIGLTAGLSDYARSGNPTQATAIGATMGLMPFFMRNAKRAASTFETPEQLQQYLEGKTTPQLNDVQTARPVAGTGGGGELTPLLNESTTAARPIFGTDTATERAKTFIEGRPPALPAAEPPIVEGGQKPISELPEAAQPLPIQDTTASKLDKIVDNQPAATPVTVEGKVYGSQQEAIDATTKERTPTIVTPAAAAEPTVQAAINPSRRLTLKSVMHADDQDMLKKAADKLGVEYQGKWPGSNNLEFKIPDNTDHPAYGANFGIEQGATYKDLKNALQAKKDAFEVDRPQWEAAKLKREGAGITPAPTPAEPKVATLQLAERPVTPEETTNEMYGESKWTHVVDVTNEKGEAVGKIRGNVTANGFQVKGANIEKSARGKGQYQKVIKQLAEKYGSVQSDTDMQPAAKAAWKKVGATPLEDGSYKLEGPKENATLQPKAAATAEPSPSSPETPAKPSGEALPPATGGFETGATVTVDPFGDGPERATIMGASPEAADHIRVKLADGSEVDVRPQNIKALPTITDVGFKAELADKQATVQNYGTAEEIAALQEQNARKGMKIGTRVGEHGAYDAELALAMGKYIAAPIVGGTVAYAMSDPDHRFRNAMLAAITIGAVNFAGTRILRALAEGHPDLFKTTTTTAKTATGQTTTTTSKFQPGKLYEAVKEDFKDVAGATFASKQMAQAASQSGEATALQKIARWMEKNFVVDPNAARITQAAHEQVRILADTMHNALASIVNDRKTLTPDIIANIGAYWKGQMDDAGIMRALGNRDLSNKVQLVAQARTALQNIIMESLPQGKLRSAIKESIDSYLTTSYRLFHDPKYFPTDTQIESVARELIGKWQAGDPELTLASMKDIITQHLKELKANKELFSAKGSYGESIGSVLGRKEPLTDAFKNMLGIYSDPLHEMAFTELKLVGGAHSARALSMIADGVKADGLKFAMSGGERDATMAKLQAAISRETDPRKVATLQSQMNDLQSYLPVQTDPRYGKLSGLFLDRRMRDSLATWDTVSRWNSNPMARVIGDLNNRVKAGHTLYSPLQLTRQILSMPMLGLMAKTLPSDWWRAWRSLTADPQEYLRLRSLGVVGSSDFVRGVLRADVSDMVQGKLDNILQNNVLKKGLAQWREIYRLPDLMSRVAAFQKEESRLLRMGVGKAEAAQRGIDYANRYAINYGAAPPGIQLLRRLPFVNQYLTFAFEVARITKNLMQDAVMRRDPAAIAVLTGMSTVPILIQKISEAQLSPMDRDAWEQAKGLAPDYSRGNFKFVTGRLPNGHFHYYDFTPLIIHDKWMKMVRDVMNGDVKAFNADNPVLGWENTPLLNVATSQISGQDIHTKEKLDSVSSRLDAIRRDLAPTLLGTDLDRFQEALTRNAEGSLGIMSPKTGREVSLGGILGSYATAVRGYTVNPNYLIRQAVFDAKSSMDSERMMMNRVLQTNAGIDAKQAAISRYQMAAKQIQMQLRDRLKVTDLSNAPSF
jgi:hypothetical protein